MKHITQVPYTSHQVSLADKSSAVKLILAGTIIIALLILGYGKIAQVNTRPLVGINNAEPDGLATELKTSVFAGVVSFDSLISMLASPSPATRWQAVYKLSESADPRAVGSLIALLDDPEPDIRYRVVRGLGNFRDSRVLDPLLYCLSDDDKFIRIEAIHSLGKVGDERTVRMLCLLTLDEDDDIRLEAVLALAAIKDSSSIETLEDALIDESLIVRKEAARALIEITGKVYEADTEGDDYLSDSMSR